LNPDEAAPDGRAPRIPGTESRWVRTHDGADFPFAAIGLDPDGDAVPFTAGMIWVYVGPATHLTMLGAPDRTFIINCDAATGAFAARQAFAFTFRGERDSWAVPGATLGAGWTALTGFATGLRRFVLTHDAVAARTALFRLDAGLEGSAALLPVIDTGVGTGDQWTSVSAALLAGTPHMLGYNSATGVAALFRIDTETTTPGLAEVASWRTPDRVWQTGWNHVVAFSERGVAFVLRSDLSGARDLIRTQQLRARRAGATDLRWQRRGLKRSITVLAGHRPLHSRLPSAPGPWAARCQLRVTGRERLEGRRTRILERFGPSRTPVLTAAHNRVL
jgi:hypothetical protein